METEKIYKYNLSISKKGNLYLKLTKEKITDKNIIENIKLKEINELDFLNFNVFGVNFRGFIIALEEDNDFKFLTEIRSKLVKAYIDETEVGFLGLEKEEAIDLICIIEETLKCLCEA